MGQEIYFKRFRMRHKLLVGCEMPKTCLGVHWKQRICSWSSNVSFTFLLFLTCLCLVLKPRTQLFTCCAAMLRLVCVFFAWWGQPVNVFRSLFYSFRMNIWINFFTFPNIWNACDIFFPVILIPNAFLPLYLLRDTVGRSSCESKCLPLLFLPCFCWG